jgi:ubiquinone/menaquinone biosynthesis C-methylase UbiE
MTRPCWRTARPAQEEAMSSQEQERTQAAWDKIAAGYDRTNTETQQWLGAESLRRAGLTAGMRFLDVAAGSGALSLPAARLGATVLATDLSPAMLALLTERARRESLDIDTRVMDGHNLELEENTFDMAGSQFGVMTFPDQPRGIREMTRVVKPGGRVLPTVYGSPSEIDFLSFFCPRRSVGAARLCPHDGSTATGVSARRSGDAAQRAY